MLVRYQPSGTNTSPPLPSADQALRMIVAGTAADTGESFFHSLVRHLAAAFSVRYAFVAELVCPQPPRIRTLGYWSDQGFTDNIEIDLTGTPCAQLLEHNILYYPRECWQQFPDSRFLASKRIESYLGVSLNDSAGQPLGMLVVMHDRPTAPDSEISRSILTLFATRAAAELERQRQQQALQKAHQLLEQRVEERTAELQLANAALEREVAQHQRALEELRQGRQRYQGILDAQQTLILRCSPEGRITYQNDAYAKAFGLEVGQVFYAKVHPDDQEATRRAMAQLFQPPYTCSLEQRTLFGDQWRWIHWQDSVIRDREGNIVEIQGVGFDIHDRKCAEEALRDSEERFRTIIDQSPISIQILGPDGQIARVNRACREFWGLGPEALGNYNILRDRQLECLGVMEQVRAAFAGQPQVLPVVRYVPPAGRFSDQERWTVATLYPVKNADGSVREMVLLHEDVSARRQAEQALRDSERQHRRAAEFNRRLLKELDHRVRNNLASLLSLLQLMKQRAADVPSFAAALESRIRAMTYVHQLMGDCGWQALDLRALITSLLGAVQSIARHAIPLRLEGPELTIDPDHPLPLAMILMELFTNSSKYGAHSVSSGQLAITWELAPQHRLRLRWRESGGPRITAPITPSLGTELIQSFVRLELRGRLELRYPPDGADHLIEFSLPGQAETQKAEG